MGVSIGLCNNEKSKKLLWVSFPIIGLIGSIIAFIIKVTQTKKTNIAMIKFNRQVIVFIMLALILSFIVGIIDRIIKNNKIIRTVYIVMVSLSLGAAVQYIFPQVYQFTREFVYFGEETISTMSLLRFVGFFFGIVVSFLVGFSAHKVYNALCENGQKLFVIMSILVFAINYSFRGVSAMVRMKLLKAKGIVFQIMIIEDNYHSYFIYALLLVGLLWLIISIRRNSKIVGQFKNNALRRKEKARLRNRRRWSYSLLLTSLLAVFILSVVNYIDTKPPAEVPLQEYKENDKQIFIDLSELEDGHLHKFSYKTPNGFDVAFLAVKKPQGSAYGLGLDACEICGVAGYFERGDDVVCRRCDVVMNKMTIGFKGGCNPIPFPYEVLDGQIVIDKVTLEKEEKRFK